MTILRLSRLTGSAGDSLALPNGLTRKGFSPNPGSIAGRSATLCLDRGTHRPYEKAGAQNAAAGSLIFRRLLSPNVDREAEDKSSLVKDLMQKRMEKLRGGINVIRPAIFGANTETEYEIGKSRRVGLIGIKRGITNVWDVWGRFVPVTVAEICDCVVTRSSKNESDKDDRILIDIASVQRKNPNNMPRHRLNQYYRWSSSPMNYRASFSVTPGGWLPAGFKIPVTHLVPGQYVSIRAKTVSKGFQGVMKRWGFKGMPGGHGVRFVGRHGGSIGSSTDPGRVIKGKKMPGRMGGKYLTQPHQVYKIDPANNLVYLKGLVQGPDNRPLIITDRLEKARYSKLFPKDSVIPFPSLPDDIKDIDSELFMPLECYDQDPYIIR